jgi:four helix bundle protein
MKESIILEKTYRFSLRIIKLYRYLTQHKEFALANQVLRSGTSIGANSEEATGASSYNDFKAKMDIAYKEARETRYWLRLFKDSNILESKLADSFLDECEEILRIIGSIQTTVKEKNSHSRNKRNS